MYCKQGYNISDFYNNKRLFLNNKNDIWNKYRNKIKSTICFCSKYGKVSSNMLFKMNIYFRKGDIIIVIIFLKKITVE